MITFQKIQPGETLPPAILDRMADKMLEIGMNGVAVDADTLFERSDFTRAEIEKHGREAADLARARAIRQVA
jgi:hypothetical protein